MITTLFINLRLRKDYRNLFAAKMDAIGLERKGTGLEEVEQTEMDFSLN